MTSEQLEQLKAMPLIERTKKYTPLVIKGDITRKEYEWIMALGAPQEGVYNAPQGDLSPTTHHTDKIVGKSQKERLYSLLRDGAWHDNHLRVPTYPPIELRNNAIHGLIHLWKTKNTKPSTPNGRRAGNTPSKPSLRSTVSPSGWFTT